MLGVTSTFDTFGFEHEYCLVLISLFKRIFNIQFSISFFFGGINGRDTCFQMNFVDSIDISLHLILWGSMFLSRVHIVTF